MRYDIETFCEDVFAAFLKKNCSTQPGMILDPESCPIVTSFDPMDVDCPDRVIVKAPEAETDISDPGVFTATVEVTIETQWAQATLKEDYCRHTARINDVRDKLMAANLTTLLAAVAGVGAVIDFVKNKRQFTKHFAESTQTKWICASTIITINGHFVAG